MFAIWISTARKLSGSLLRRSLIVLAALAGLGLGILRLGIRSSPIPVVAYLTTLLTGLILVGTIIYRVVNTKIVEHYLLTLAVGVVPPACGAWLLGSASTRKSIPIGTGLASKSLFTTLAEIAFTLTVALMIEMRFAGSLPKHFEQERREVFRSFYIGGGLTTCCAIAGVCLIGNPDTQGRLRPISNLVAALFGASIYGTFVIAMLLVMLAAIPRDGFKKMAISEEIKLSLEDHPSRSRNVPTRRYLRQLFPAGMLSVVVIVGAIFVWWTAILGLIVSAAWLSYAWMSREQTPRADEGLPLHPITFVAVILAGVSIPFTAHAIMPSLEPAQTQTARQLYEIAVVALGVGYVAFAAGHPPEPRTELLPSLHTIGVWCGVAALAGLGLASSISAAERSGGGWFAFWITLTATPAMLGQLLLLRSRSVRA